MHRLNAQIKNTVKSQSGKIIGLSLLVTTLLTQATRTLWAQDYPIKPVPFTSVELTDHFWKPKVRVNATVTIPYIIRMCKEHGRVDNFLKAAGKMPAGDKLTTYPFDDTDIYKLLEGASYSLQTTPNPELDRQLDTLIGIIGAAQEPDGYLYTFRTAKVKHPQEWIGKSRWENAEDLSHELYNCGHLYEAAVAHFQATGKRTLLDIAIKNADLLVEDFGWGKIEKYPGHPVVEMGLVKLYRVTHNTKYLDLAKFFLDVRGPQSGNPGKSYNQSNIRLINQHEAEGHAVRAAYLYSGMADVAALTKSDGYLHAIDDIWSDIVDHKIYITGGIGATGNGEAFGENYDLPNMSAYAETCAAIANVYFNERMFLLHGDSRYIDILEKTLYNGLLSGVSLSGDHFFYPNPLASLGQHSRSAWFDCACCITNISRFMPSMPEYIYAQNKNQIYLNLFVSNKATFDLSGGKISLEPKSDYPWDGKVVITVDPMTNKDFQLHIRIPGWARGQALPGDLYHFIDTKAAPINISVNGEETPYKMNKGYAILKRHWKKGDLISFTLPMPVQKVLAKTQVKSDIGHFALQKGPIIYCIEGADRKDSSVMNLLIDTSAVIKTSYLQNKLHGIAELTAKGFQLKRITNSDSIHQEGTRVTAIPYYSWNNRGADEMEVWIPYDLTQAKPKPAPSIASNSKVSGSQVSPLMLKALNDQFDPADSHDNSTNYLHWWPRKNEQQWVQYDFSKPQEVVSASVYWYDDGPWGGCRVPASWKLMYKKGNDWVSVDNKEDYPVKKDDYNTIHFSPVKTAALRLVVQLPKDNSAGILEWKVN